MRNTILLVGLMLLSPLATAGDFKPPADNATNPPPSVTFNTFQRFQEEPVAMGAPWAGQKGNEGAKQRLQANLDERMKPLLAEWNGKASGSDGRTLKIAPEITYVRFITGGKRFFGGAFAGSSGMMVKVHLTDAATGAVIASPEFYQQANGWGAAYSFGATDKTMIIRLSNMITEYLRANYDKAVGAPVTIAPDVSN